MNSLDPLFAPRSIALIGASPRTDSPGGIVFHNLAGFRGNIYPVTPVHREIRGLTCYPEPAALPEEVDLAVILRPAAEVPGTVARLAGRCRCAVVVSAGFAEIGRGALQEELARAGREAGVRLLGPNCLGVLNPARRLDTFFLPADRMRRPRRGNVAVVSQSGAVLVSLLEALAKMGVGVSRGVNYGNAVDLDAPDLYEYLAGDGDTGVVLAYLESVSDGRRFIESASRLAGHKPLLLLKGGKGMGGQSAAFSHTGRLAGRYEVFSSILRQNGIHEVGEYEELLDGARALSFQRPVSGTRVCIITNAGGAGVLAADACRRTGLETPPLPSEVRDGLRGLFPPFYSIGNPLDLTGQVRDADYGTALAAARDHYDAFLVIALTGVAGVTLDLAPLLGTFRGVTSKPLVAHVAQGSMARRLEASLARHGIPSFPTPERAVRGIGVLLGGAE